MKKLSMQTPDLTEGNITKIAELFPNVITEKEGVNGTTEKAVDFDLLKQMLSKELVEDDNERYRLDWPGKKASLLKANTPITKTLRPDRDSSVNFDTTENVFIEGDNFEVLKVLQESYLGKVKMIYIDPPYNTGKDFVYKDNFTKSKDKYDEELGSEDEEGGKLFRNTDTNGRFHSDWLSMMYERLIVARDLLKDDGVIFISIDDNEVSNLRKIGDEIFGENNFISQITREAIKGGSQSDTVRVVHDYVLSYAKNKEEVIFSGHEKEGIDLNLEDERGKYAKGRELNKWGAGSRREDSPSMYFPIKGPNGEDVYPIRNDGSDGRWRLGKIKMHQRVLDNDVIFEKRENGTYIVYEKLRDDSSKIKQFTTLFKDNYINAKGTESLKGLFKTERAIFDYSKPVEFIKDLIVLSDVKESELVLDFFAGSCTTAHSVIELNAEDEGNRKFVVIQLKEDVLQDSEAGKLGYRYISEISKERIRRAGKKILEENVDTIATREKPLDVGFRAYKADTTNMKDVYYHPSQVAQGDLFKFVDNIKEDRTPEDLLTQVILSLGLTLDLPIEKKELRGNAVYFVAGNALVACFDDKIDFGIVDDIATYEPLKVVFKDASFKEEQDRTNVDTRMKRLSPETIITVL